MPKVDGLHATHPLGFGVDVIVNGGEYFSNSLPGLVEISRSGMRISSGLEREALLERHPNGSSILIRSKSTRHKKRNSDQLKIAERGL